MLDGRVLCDLHTHTTASDGMNKPSENVRRASEKGLGAIAITDHDTVAGIKEALESGGQYGVTVIPGVEISTRASEQDIHVLGYYMDIENPILLQRLEELRTVRDYRNEEIIDNLNKLGMDITIDEVKMRLGELRKEGESIGRPHIAAVLVDKGYATDIRDAFNRYLAEGAAAYVMVSRITPLEACIWISEAGGVPTLAHPGIYGNDELVISLLESGSFKGLEVYHSDHSPEDEERYKQMARRYHLIATGGSDYHGSRQGEVFHGDIGNRTVSKDVLEQLRLAR